MGFTIDLISGEIQDYSSSVKDHKEVNEKTRAEEWHIHAPVPGLQEYVPQENVSNVIPDSLVNIDIDVFIDQM